MLTSRLIQQELSNQINQTSIFNQIEQAVGTINPANLLKIIAQSLIVLGFFWVINRTISSIIDRIQKQRDIERRVTRQIKVFSSYIVWTLALLTVLGVMGINLTLIATSLGIVGIAVGFAARDLLSNLLSGIFIMFDRDYLVNDAVLIDGTYGIVRLITLRNTEIKTFDGNIVIIPNSKVASGKIINMTSGSPYMLTTIEVNISYDEDYEKVKKLMRETALEVEGVYMEEDIRFRVEELEERLQGVEVEMYFTVKADQEPWTKGEVYEKVMANLVKNKIKFHRQAPNAETDYERRE